MLLLLSHKGIQVLKVELCKVYKEHNHVVYKKSYEEYNQATHSTVFLRTVTSHPHSNMRAIYWLPKEVMTTVKFNSLIRFLGDIGLKSVKNHSVIGNAIYLSYASLDGMQDPFANILALANQVQVQVWILFLAGYGWQWGQWVILLNEVKPEMHFLENITVQDGKAQNGRPKQVTFNNKLCCCCLGLNIKNNIVEKVICLSTSNKSPQTSLVI